MSFKATSSLVSSTSAKVTESTIKDVEVEKTPKVEEEPIEAEEPVEEAPKRQATWTEICNVRKGLRPDGSKREIEK